MKKTIISTFILLLCFAPKARGLDNFTGNPLSLTQCNNQDFFHSLSAPDLGIQQKSSENHKVSRTRIISGTVMVVGGAILSAGGYYLGNKYYDKYRKSAFTENTDVYRKMITGCRVLTIGGAVIAGTGVLLFSFAF